MFIKMVKVSNARKLCNHQNRSIAPKTKKYGISFAFKITDLKRKCEVQHQFIPNERKNVYSYQAGCHFKGMNDSAV